MAQDLEDLFQIGVITRVHGVHGEVKVFPMTDDVRRFKKLKKTLIDTGSGFIEAECEQAKFFKQFVILKFKGYDSIESIEKYCRCGIFVTREDAVQPGKDEYFIADLIDMRIIDDTGLIQGSITDVIQTGANDVYDIRLDDGRNLLLPAIKDCILSVDTKSRLMKIHVLDGLLEEI